MKINTNLKTIVGILLLGILTIGLLLTSNSNTITDSNEESVSLTYHSTVCKTITRTDGSIENLGCSKNLFQHSGMNFTASQLAGTLTGSTNLTLHNTSIDVVAIAVKGISNPACALTINASETYLCGQLNTSCGMGIARADAVRINSTATPSAGNWTVTKEFTSTCDGQTVNGTGLFNSTGNQSGGQSIFFAQNTFTSVTLNNNDKINITWFLWVT